MVRRILSVLTLFALFLPTFVAADFFYHAPTFREGPNEGKLMDVSLKRAIRILSDDQFEGRFKAPPGYITVANIFHNKRFYIAHVPREGVEKILFLNEPFSALMSHSMLRFVFKPESPVYLVGEVPAKIGENPILLLKPQVLKDLLMTPEVVAPMDGSAFKPVLGMKNYFAVVARVTSLTGRGVTPYTERKYLAHQRPLNFTSEEASLALMNGLEDSDRRGMWTMYHTLAANCNVISFFFLKSGRSFVNEDQNICQRFMGHIRLHMERNFPIVRWHPPLSTFILRWRGYIDWQTQSYPLLNDDPAFLELAATYPQKTKCELEMTSEPILEVGQ